MSTHEHPRISVLGPLRGVASFAVVWFHFTQGNPGFLPDGAFKASGHYGYLGVEMFFVISGFVIPWSLCQAQYHRAAHWKYFLAKRVVRLDPPYFASIALVLVLNWLAMHLAAFHGTTSTITTPQLLAHLGYANAVLRYDWVNPVYWTLAIEAMFYLAVALAYPYLVRMQWEPFVYLAIIGLPFLVPDDRWIFHYLPLFGMGVATFQWYTGRVKLLHFLGVLLILAGASVFAMSWAMTLAGVGTALGIATMPSAESRALTWLGKVSYSLYLVHLPIGGKIVNLGARYAHTWPLRLGVLALAIAASLVAAWLLWRLVEEPARRWAAAIAYPEQSKRELIPVLANWETGAAR